MNVEKLSNNRVRYTFEVSVDEFEHGLDHAFNHIQKDVEIKGFRKGHVTRGVYETKFGVESLYEEALNHVFHHKYHDAMADETYTIVGQPKINIEIDKIKRGEVFTFNFEVAVKPEVILGQYKDIEVKPLETEVTDADLEKELLTILTSKSSLEPKEGDTLEIGDTAIFDFEGFLNNEPFEGGKAENYQLEIGSNQFIPGFEEQMVGLKTGDSKDINVTFPENYQAENLAGQPVVFKITLHEIKTKTKAELNDAFVKDLEREGIETVDALREATLKEITNRKETQNKNHITNEVISQVVNNASVDIPVEMIEEEANNQKEQVKNQAKQYNIEYEMFVSMNGMTVEQFEARINEEAKRRVQTTLIIEAVGKAENFDVTKEEVDTKYEEIAKQYQMEVSEVAKYLPEAAITVEVRNQKAYQFIIDHVKLV